MGPQPGRCAAAGALLLALLLALAPAARAIENGSCIVEIPVTGSLGLQGTVTYTVTYEDYGEDYGEGGEDHVHIHKITTKVPFKAGKLDPKGDISGVIPLVFPPGTACSVANSATDRNDTGYAALTQALAGAKIGTDKHPAYKVKVANFSGKVTTGNPNSEIEFATWMEAEWRLEDLTMDFDLTAKGALKPGTPKTYKTTAVSVDGNLTTFVYFNKGYYSDGFDLTVDVAKELKLTKATGCKVTVKTGAVSLACAALTLTAAPYSLETADYKIAAKLLLKGGTLAGSAPLRSAKVLLAP